MRSSLLCMSLLAATAFAADGASTLNVQPPKARIEAVEDTLHGQKITDPYRWLEDGNAAETQQWTRDQLAYARSVLDAQHG